MQGAVLRILTAVGLAATLASCTVHEPQRSRAETRGYVAVEVLYATDRARSGDTAPARFYATGRGTLEYGVTTVSIPHVHRRGDLETPSMWRFEVSADPARHVKLLSVEPLGHDAYGRSVASR